jgi:hypothetical protein
MLICSGTLRREARIFKSRLPNIKILVLCIFSQPTGDPEQDAGRQGESIEQISTAHTIQVCGFIDNLNFGFDGEQILAFSSSMCARRRLGKFFSSLK